LSLSTPYNAAFAPVFFLIAVGLYLLIIYAKHVYILKDDIKHLHQVNSSGIGEAFQTLAEKFLEGYDRAATASVKY